MEKKVFFDCIKEVARNEPFTKRSWKYIRIPNTNVIFTAKSGVSKRRAVGWSQDRQSVAKDNPRGFSEGRVADFKIGIKL